MMTALFAALVLLIQPAPVTIPRLRPTSDVARDLVTLAVARSPTIQDLITEIEHSDLIIYFEVSHDVGESLAQTVFLFTNPAGRFLKISIDAKADPRRRIELLGHELRHALEIADAPQVRDGAGMRQLFRSIGWALERATAFETDAAVVVERQVRRELARARLMPDAGRPAPQSHR